MYRIFLQFCSHETGSAQEVVGGVSCLKLRFPLFAPIHNRQWCQLSRFWQETYAFLPRLPLSRFGKSPALNVHYKINIEYLVKNKTDLVWDLAHV